MIPIVVEPEAELDIVDAYDWYEAQRAGLGERFLTAVRECLDRVQEEPLAFPTVEHGVRRALLRTFPYSVLYLARADLVIVVACFHGRRDPSVWKKRV
jgi:plasmid stabilization system protein ParE